MSKTEQPKLRVLTHVKHDANLPLLPPGVYSRADLDGLEPGLTDTLLEHGSAEYDIADPAAMQASVEGLASENEKLRRELEAEREKTLKAEARQAEKDAASQTPDQARLELENEQLKQELAAAKEAAAAATTPAASDEATGKAEIAKAEAAKKAQEERGR